MSQHDMNIANGPGAAFRADLNGALGALASQSSGAAAPSPTFPCQVWADTGTGRLWQRNIANTLWIDRGPLDSAGAAIATQAQAESGTDNALPMSALRVWQAVAKIVVQATETVFGWAKTATQAQVNTGTDDATIVTPKKLRFGVSVSIGTNGYIVLPSWLNGLIIQWGKITPVSVGAGSQIDNTVTFPIAFPAAILFGSASAFTNTAMSFVGAETFNWSATSMHVAQINSFTSAQVVGATWLAIGY